MFWMIDARYLTRQIDLKPLSHPLKIPKKLKFEKQKRCLRTRTEKLNCEISQKNERLFFF